jgi:NAD(P)-dependent dehydrogenase (short-subunit alcohol dehydrogenase family)
MLGLEGRVALVTGGGSGIGLASCRALAAGGATVIVADRDIGAAERGAADVRSAGGRAAAYKVDVCSVPEIRAMFDFVSETYGKLNVLFSHAGIQGPAGLDVSEEQFDDAIAVNLKSHFFATRYALPLMRQCAPHASIIYTSSVSGLRAPKHSPLYGTCKAGLLMMMRSVARQCGPDGVRANAICPGPADTAFARDFAASTGMDEDQYDALLEATSRSIPLGRIAQPSDITGTVVFLASDQSAYLTGAAIPVDGGLTS